MSVLKTVGASPLLATGLSAAIAVGAALWHATLQLNDVSTAMAAQKTTVDRLEAKVDDQAEKLGGVSIGVASLQGQVATLNQKVDDDEKLNRRLRDGH